MQAKYIYFCRGCGQTFSVAIEEEEPASDTAECVFCGNKAAIRMMRSPETPEGGACVPGSGC